MLLFLKEIFMNTMPKRAFHGGTNAVMSGRNGMSQFEISKRIYSSGILSRIELSMSAKLVLIALGNHYNPEKNGMFPSQKFISEQIGISLKSVERAIKELKNANLLVYVTKKVNCYYFTTKFFAEIKLSEDIGQIDGRNIGQIDGQTEKHEQKKNREGEKKSGGYQARSFMQQPKGMNYQPVKLDLRRDEENPWNDEAVARKFIADLRNSMANEYVRKKVHNVCEHWEARGVNLRELLG